MFILSIFVSSPNHECKEWRLFVYHHAVYYCGSLPISQCAKFHTEDPTRLKDERPSHRSNDFVLYYDSLWILFFNGSSFVWWLSGEFVRPCHFLGSSHLLWIYHLREPLPLRLRLVIVIYPWCKTRMFSKSCAGSLILFYFYIYRLTCVIYFYTYCNVMTHCNLDKKDR